MMLLEIVFWQLNQKQRKILATKVADLGNIAIGSLIFGRVIAQEAFSKYSILFGFLIALLSYLSVVLLLKEKERES